MMTVTTWLGFVHAVGWATYFGGAIAMELLWRPAQVHIPPSQVNVVCQRMGRRYRWIALSALAAIALSGIGLLVQAGHVSVRAPIFRPPVMLSSPYGRTLIALGLCWALLVALVAVMAVAAHPALHARTPAEMTPEERDRARAAVRRAIRRMDLLLRCELGVAFVAALLGVSLRFGGLF